MRGDPPCRRPRAREACAKLGSCGTGEAKITPGFDLPARYVIHAVGPIWDGGDRGEDRLLASCYRTSLVLAAGHGLASIAFPAISTGIFGFPPDRAALVAVRSVRTTLGDVPSIKRAVFCCFGAESRKLHEAALAATARED
jgi:O-acetyl-ADP-ribose deacetylase